MFRYLINTAEIANGQKPEVGKRNTNRSAMRLYDCINVWYFQK